jgi:hypothetical protein
MGEDVGSIHVMTGNVVALDKPMALVREKKNKSIVHAVMYAYRGRVDGQGPFTVRPHMTGCYGLYRGEHMLSTLNVLEPTDATVVTCVFCLGWRGEKYWPQGVDCKAQKEFPEWSGS